MKSFLVILIFILTQNIFASDFYAGNNGDWNNSSIWYFLDGTGNPTVNANSYPSVGDNVIIDGYQILVTSNESCKSVLVKSDNKNHDTYLRVNDGYTLNVTNDVDVKTVGNYWVDINLYAYGTLNIGGDLNFERAANNTTNNELKLYIQDGSINITGDFNYNYLSSEPSMDTYEVYIYDGTLNCTNTNFTQASDGKIVIELRYAGQWNVSNNFTITRNNANDFKLDMFHTSSINVDGNFLLDQNNCQDVYMTFNQTSSFNTGGDFTIDFDQSNNSDSHINIQMWDETDIRVEGSLDISLNDVDNETHKIYFKVDEDAQVIVGKDDGNFAESATMYIENGSELYFDLNRDAQFIVYGDTYFKSDGNGDDDVSTYLFIRLNADLNGNTLLDVKRDMYVEANLEDWDHVQFEMNGTGIINVERDLIINNNTNISHTQFLMDRDAQINVGNNLLINQNSKGAVEIIMNDNNNGDAETDATKITTGNNFTITATDLRYIELTLKDYSEIGVNGDFDISISDYDQDWQGIDAELTAYSEINVGGDFTIDNTDRGTKANTGFTLENYASINVGTSGINSDFSVTHNGLDDLEFTLQNNTSINVYGDFTFDKKNGAKDAILYLNDDAQVNVYKHLILKNENDDHLVFVDIHDDDAILNVRGNIDMTNAVDEDRIKIESSGESHIYLGGSLLRNAIPNKYGILDFSGNGTLHMNGDGTYAQVIAETYGDGNDGVTYQYVILNNTSTTVPQFTMEGVAEIYEDRDLKFTDGIVEATSSNYFEIQDDATVSDASDDSYVDGYIHKIGNDAFTFPVGDTDPGVPDVDDDATRYAPLEISAPSSSTTDFYCRYFQLNPTTTYGTAKEITLNHISSHEIWLLKPVAGSPSVKVTLSWLQDRSGDISSTSDLRVAHWDGSIWNDYGNDGTTGTNFTGTIIVNNVSNFSPFTLASVNDENPLPINLIKFTASLENNIVNLNWSTNSEINNDFFTIERSSDGVNFVKIGRINGAGNSNCIKKYYMRDSSPYSGVSYYRIKQTDFDGTNECSQIRAINFINKEEKLRITMYPNPVENRNKLNIHFTNNVTNVDYNIFDMYGRTIMSQNSINTIDANNVIVNTQELSNGIYVINLVADGVKFSKKIVIKK